MAHDKTELARRSLLIALGGAGLAAASAPPARAQPAPSRDEKRKARYQPNSKHIQDYYRVNRY